MVIKPLVQAIYIAYVCVGVCLGLVGILYMAYISGHHLNVALTFFGVGAFMLCVGGVAFHAIQHENYLNLILVECVNVLLFIALLITFVIGLILVLDIKDPIRTGVDKSFLQKQYRTDLWQTNYCLEQVVGRCETDFKGDFETRAKTNTNFTKETTAGDQYIELRFLFGDCKDAYTYDPSNVANDGKNDLWRACDECAVDCKETLIKNLKENIDPAMKIAFGTFGFATLAFLANYGLLDDSLDIGGRTIKDDGGILRLAAIIFNFIVCAAGVALTASGVYAHYELTQDCSLVDHACANWTVTMGIFVGICTFFVGLMGTLSVHKGVRTIIKFVNAIMLAFAFGLLLLGIFLAILSGGLDTINAESEKRFPELRRQYESQDKNYCMAGTIPMTDIECRVKIKEDVESQLSVAAIVAGIVAAGFVVTMYFTMKIIHHFRDSPLSDDLRQNEMKNPINDVEYTDEPELE